MGLGIPLVQGLLGQLGVEGLLLLKLLLGRFQSLGTLGQGGNLLLQRRPGQRLVNACLFLELVPLSLQGADLLLQLGGLVGSFRHCRQLLPHLGQLALQPGNLAHAFVDLTFILPRLQPALHLRKGDVLLPCGDQGGNAPLQLRGGGERQPARAQEGGAGKDGQPHAGELLAAVGGSELRYRLLRAGVDGGKGAKGGVPPGAPADGDVPALPLQAHLPLHGGAGPGLIVVFIRQIALLVPVPGVDAIEHGLPEGGPGGLAALVGGVDEVEPLTRLQMGLVQLAKGGSHGNQLHR